MMKSTFVKLRQKETKKICQVSYFVSHRLQTVRSQVDSTLASHVAS